MHYQLGESMSRPGTWTSGHLQQIYSIGPAFFGFIKLPSCLLLCVTIPKPNYPGQMHGAFACLAYLSHTNEMHE